MTIKQWENHFSQMNHFRLQELIRILQELRDKDGTVWYEFEDDEHEGLDRVLKIAVIIHER